MAWARRRETGHLWLFGMAAAPACRHGESSQNNVTHAVFRRPRHRLSAPTFAISDACTALVDDIPDQRMGLHGTTKST